MGTSQKANILNRLDQTILRMADDIAEDIYNKAILPTVNEWLDTSDSISKLKEVLNSNINGRVALLVKKCEFQLRDFLEYTQQNLNSMDRSIGDINIDKLSKTIYNKIGNLLAALGTIVAGVVSGGSGMALIASGPAGWITGAIVAAVVLFYGKEKFENSISKFIENKRIPKMVKRVTLKKKIPLQLTTDRAKFESEVYKMLQEQFKSLYETIENE